MATSSGRDTSQSVNYTTVRSLPHCSKTPGAGEAVAEPRHGRAVSLILAQGAPHTAFTGRCHGKFQKWLPAPHVCWSSCSLHADLWRCRGFPEDPMQGYHYTATNKVGHWPTWNHGKFFPTPIAPKATYVRNFLNPPPPLRCRFLVLTLLASS